MNSDFPRLIALLRKERGESQKMAAANLGISQALLSHYEKGIRECGLDFLCRVADYYNVSTDYLLGRDSRRRPDETFEESGELQQKSNVFRGSVFPALGKALTTSSVSMLFDLMQNPSYKELAGEVQRYLSMVLYKLFRYYYGSNPQNQPAFFAISEELFPELSNAALLIEEMKLRATMRKINKKSKSGDLPLATYDSLAKSAPQSAGALLNMLKTAETSLVKLSDSI